VQRDYRQALAEFQKVLDVARTSPKVPDAASQVGCLCYRSLRDESSGAPDVGIACEGLPEEPVGPGRRAAARLRGKAAAAR